MPTTEDEVPNRSIPLALQSLFFKVSQLPCLRLFGRMLNAAEFNSSISFHIVEHIPYYSFRGSLRNQSNADMQ